MIPHRTQHQINQQAKDLFIRVYESKISVNLHGNIPLKTDLDYHYIRKECITIADRYGDEALVHELKLNF